jgi:serine protease inhibitor
MEINMCRRGFSLVAEMRVDHPFIFIVFDASSGLVLCEVVVNEIPA